MEAKALAAKAAVRHVEDGMVVALGSGTTVSYVIKELALSKLNVKVLAASSQTYLEAVRAGLTHTTLDQNPEPDIYLDSFDQVDPGCNMLKGRGGAFLREKVLAAASRKRVFVGESSKFRQVLDGPVPLEVLPFALGYVLRRVSDIGGKAAVRMSQEKNGPTVTDNGNYVVDVDFGPITDPSNLDRELRSIPGVLENGLFTKMADKVIIAHHDGKVEEIKPP
jgi:ribose 5-phosphate isomerase A